MERANNFANTWNISCQIFSIKYLGVPLGGKPLTKGYRENIKEKLLKKLSSWKYQNISKGGKLTLLKASLASLPTYQLSVFKAPTSIYKEIEITKGIFFGEAKKIPMQHT